MGVPLSPSRPEEPEPEPGWDVGRCCRIIQKKLIHFFPFALLFVFFFFIFWFYFFIFIWVCFSKQTQGHTGAGPGSPLCFHIKCNLVLKSIFPFGREKITIVLLVTCSPTVPEQMLKNSVPIAGKWLIKCCTIVISARTVENQDELHKP